jgi:uncharacterized membrane protein YfcA
MKKDMIILIVRIILSIVGIVSVCVGHNEANQILLYVGLFCIIIAFLLSLISRKKTKNNPNRNL